MNAERDAWLLIASRTLRGLFDGALVILLPAAWLAAGRGGDEISALSTATMLGSALATLGVGLVAHRVAPLRVLFAACALLTLTGLGFAFAPSLGWLLAIAFVGTFNPSVGDVSVFLPTEQALLAGSGAPEQRAARFARYNVAGSAAGVLGSYGAGQLAALGIGIEAGAHGTLLAYALLGGVLIALYAPLRAGRTPPPMTAAQPLERSRGTVIRLSALFTLDSFGGGFAVQTLVVAWLLERWSFGVEQVGIVFGVAQALSAGSQLVAPLLARRIGLIRTMVFTHVPANLFLIATGFMPTASLVVACLWLRASLSQMDVPARQAYVMSVVPEEERSAAASVTNVPRSFGGAFGVWLAGPLLAAGSFPLALALGGGCKLLYDALLLIGFGSKPPPGERAGA
jgi:predicted MFS family arabinose efflux permease